MSLGPGDGVALPRTARGRFWEVDTARGIAVCMMVFYHLVYDLAAYGGYPIQATLGFWMYFADATAAAFIFLAGVSLPLSYARLTAVRGSARGLYPFYLKRGLGILAWGMVITLVTFILSPRDPIVFGILHSIGLSIILAYPFLHRKLTNLVLGLVFVAIGISLRGIGFGVPWFLWLGFQPANYVMRDYRPLLPWFGVVLLGIFVGNLLYERGRRCFALPDLSGLSPVRLLALLGRHSLAIYLVHQPVLLVLLVALGIVDPRVFTGG